MPEFDGFPLHVQVLEVRFEAAVYGLLQTQPDIRASTLLYHRVPTLNDRPKDSIPTDLSGRRLMVFERSRGENNVFLKGAKQVGLVYCLFPLRG